MLIIAAAVQADDLYFLQLTHGFLFGWYLFSPLDV